MARKFVLVSQVIRRSYFGEKHDATKEEDSSYKWATYFWLLITGLGVGRGVGRGVGIGVGFGVGL